MRLGCAIAQCTARVVLRANGRTVAARRVVLPRGAARWVSLGTLRPTAVRRLVVHAGAARLGTVQISRSSIQRDAARTRSTG